MFTFKDNKKAEEFRETGNDLYMKKHFCEALLEYNRSLCYAKPKSRAAGLAYGNRSAVYKEMGEYELCLENIQLAKANKYPTWNLHILAKREAGSRMLLAAKKAQYDDEREKYFEMTFPAHPNHPTIAKCLVLSKSNQLITKRALWPGNVIALTDPSIVLFDNGARLHHCSNCYKSSMLLNLLPCPKCTKGEWTCLSVLL